MRLKRYENSEIDSAVKQARIELGEEAMLVSVERAMTAQAGIGRYRVIFASESVNDCETLPSPAKNSPFQNGSVASKGESPKWSLVRLALSELAADLSRTPSYDVPAKTVERFPPISEYSRLSGEADPALTQRQSVPALIEVLVGPPKSGKSTAAAKLALLQANSGKKVALVHLSQPGQAFDPELASKGVIECSAESIGHLDTIVDLEPLMESIFVDTTREAGEMTDAFLRWIARRHAGVHLTLDACFKSENWLAASIEFSPFLPAHLLLSHVDQITDWSAVWRGIGGTGLPCSYFSSGPHLSSPLEFIGRVKITQVESSKAASA